MNACQFLPFSGINVICRMGPTMSGMNSILCKPVKWKTQCWQLTITAFSEVLLQKKTTGYKQKPFHCCNYQGCSNGYLYWYLSAVLLSTVFKYWYWYTRLGYWYLYWYSRLKYWELYWYWRLRYGYWYVYLVRVASSWNHTVHDWRAVCLTNWLFLNVTTVLIGRDE